MTSTKPIIVLIHGAWQTAAQWQPLSEGLIRKSYTVLQPQNATSGADPVAIRGKTYKDDVAVIRTALDPYVEAGQDMILICHSYGGIPTSAAVEGYQIHERRARGLLGGIKHVVYLVAFALPSRNSRFSWLLGDVVVLGEGAEDALYNDTEPQLSNQLLAANFYQSTASIETPQSFAAADVAVAKTYVVAENDHALPLKAQEGMIESLTDVRVVRMKPGHCIHLNTEMIPNLVNVIESIV